MPVDSMWLLFIGFLLNNYFIMELMQKEWTRFMDQMQKSQEIVSQLSKLYIILHQNVRKTILKCTIDLQYDPSQDAEHHLAKILDLLQRLNNPNDAYLKGVDPAMISKYQEQLIDLSDQVQKLLQTQRTAKNNDPKQLERIKHMSTSEKYGLKDELKQSQQRILRSKSGKRNPLKAHSDIQTESDRLINQFDRYKRQYLQKKSLLEKQMQNHLQKKNTQILFRNKYSGTNLQSYFKLRKQLIDLLLAEKHTQSIINHPLQNQSKGVHLSNDALQEKLFNQFKIKTKFMKTKVKQNILNALAQVKMKLLQEYHTSNVKKLTEGNPDTLISLAHEKKRKSQSVKALSNNKYVASVVGKFEQYQRKSKSIRQLAAKPTTARYPMAQKTIRPLIYQTGWTQELQNEHKKTLQTRLFQSKVPNSARK